MAQAFADKEVERRTKVQQTLGIRVLRPIEVKPSDERTVPFISDSTIRFEMSIFGAVMNYSIKKRYVPASQRFDERPKLKAMRRDEFTLEEYRKLHTVGRKWIAGADKPSSIWYRTVTYNMTLIACNTGMRPAEMKNLRWRDIMPAKDREGREIVVLFVQGKGKSRKLVAPKSVGDYLERLRTISKATEPNDRVFTNVTGKPAKTLYSSLIADLLNTAKLREGTQGVPRSTYCFRHTYATLRLQEGVDVYFLAEQMGTSVHMIEQHYGHVNTISTLTVCCRAWRVGSCRNRTIPGRRRQRFTISLKGVNATSRVDREPPESVFSRSRWRRVVQGCNPPNVRPGLFLQRLF